MIQYEYSFAKLLNSADRTAIAKRPRDVMNALLERQDTSAAVQALDPIEFYDLFHAVGPSDAMELMSYASAEQVQTCLDFDIWRGDSMSDTELAPWVEQMLALPDDKFAEFWKGIDPEIMALYLHRNVQLYVAEDKNDDVDIPDEASKNIAQTPDFTFWVAYPDDPDKAERLRQLIDRLYAILGIEQAWSALEAMHWEMETDLEESAYHFRTERLREYGFIPREEAAAVFTRISVSREIAAIQNATSAELYIGACKSPEKLTNSLAALDESPAAGCYLAVILSQCPTRDTIKAEMLSLAQQIAIFDGYQPHEFDGFDESMVLTAAYASIGLEYSSKRSDALAVRILTHTPLRRLVTLGYNITMDLQHKAKLLVSRGHLSIIEGSKISLLTNAQRDVIEGLLETRPRPRHSAMTPFVSAQDISQCASSIADVASRELFFGEALHKTRDDISLLAYTHDLIHGVENVSFDSAAATFLTRRLLNRDSAWDVIYTDSLPDRDDVQRAIAYEQIRSLFKSNLPASNDAALKRFAAQLQAELDDTWPVSQKKPDPHLVNFLMFASRDED